MYKTDSVPARVKTLLENVPYLRDNKPHFITQYRYFYPTDTSTEETICRAWRLVQQDIFELRGLKWSDRQKCSAVNRNKYSRSQAKPENLIKVYEDVSYIFEKETNLQYIFRKLKSIF